MSAHLQVQLHDGFVAATRLVARLHALGVAVEELHLSRDQVCVHLRNEGDLRRVRSALDRASDSAVLPEVGEQARSCGHGSASRGSVPTTYHVWSTSRNGSSAVTRPRVVA